MRDKEVVEYLFQFAIEHDSMLSSAYLLWLRLKVDYTALIIVDAVPFGLRSRTQVGDYII